MPDKPSGPGTTEGTPQGADQLQQLRDQLKAKTDDAAKFQKSYDELRSLDNRKDAELSQLRQSKSRLEELVGTDGTDMAAADRRQQESDERADRDRYKVAQLGYMVRNGVDKTGLEAAEKYVRENSDAVSAFDQGGRYDYDRILDTAGMHLRNIERDAKIAAFEKVEADARAEAEKNRPVDMARAGILGQVASEGTKQLDVSQMTSDQMLDEHLVPGMEGVPRVHPKG